MELKVGDKLKFMEWNEARLSLAKAEIAEIKDKNTYEKLFKFDAEVSELNETKMICGFGTYVTVEFCKLDDGTRTFSVRRDLVEAVVREHEPKPNFDSWKLLI